MCTREIGTKNEAWICFDHKGKRDQTGFVDNVVEGSMQGPAPRKSDLVCLPVQSKGLSLLSL